jgi:hypothetical protein
MFAKNGLKLKLSQALKNKRQQKGLTQVAAARALRSSHTYFGLSSSLLLLPKPEVGGSTPPGAIASKAVSAVQIHRALL